MDLASSSICLPMLLQTCGNENLKGISFGSSKSVHTASGKSSPRIFILSGSEQPTCIFLAALIIGSFSGSIFTITVESPTTGDFTSDNATVGSPSKNVYVTYLDKLAAGSPEGSIVSEQFNYVYSIPNGDREFVIKARDGGATPLKEYIATGTMTDTGGSNTAIRTSDT